MKSSIRTFALATIAAIACLSQMHAQSLLLKSTFPSHSIADRSSFPLEPTPSARWINSRSLLV